MAPRAQAADTLPAAVPARAPRALNDPVVDCCGRDAADCDCPKPEPRYRLEVTYGFEHTNVHDDLTASQVESGAYAFTNDMLGVASVTKLVIERKR